MTLQGPCEVEIDNKPGWGVGFGDLSVSRAELRAAVPIVRRALAFHRAAVSSSDRRIIPLVRRPFSPTMKIVDECE